MKWFVSAEKGGIFQVYARDYDHNNKKVKKKNLDHLSNCDV